jgi:hypothetical protein
MKTHDVSTFSLPPAILVDDKGNKNLQIYSKGLFASFAHSFVLVLCKCRHKKILLFLAICAVLEGWILLAVA